MELNSSLASAVVFQVNSSHKFEQSGLPLHNQKFRYQILLHNSLSLAPGSSSNTPGGINYHLPSFIPISFLTLLEICGPT